MEAKTEVPGRLRPLFGGQAEMIASEVEEGGGLGSLVPEDWRRDFAAKEEAEKHRQDERKARRGTMLAIGFAVGAVVILAVAIAFSIAWLPPRPETTIVAATEFDERIFRWFVQALAAAGLLTVGSFLLRYLTRPY